LERFWSELKRRNVIKVAIAYAVIAWLLIQVVDVVLPTFEAPQWASQTVTFLLILGFPLAVVLAWAFDVTPEGLQRTRGAKEAEPTPVSESAKAGTKEADSRPAPPSGSAPLSQSSAPGDNSIAVLPFVNISPREEDAYFAVGLHEEILNHLAKIRALSVISRTSVLRYAGATRSIPEIAAELNVSAIMEGSVRYSGKRIRITLQLIDAATDRHLWSETYDREFEDIFVIESDVAVKVAKAMQAAFSPDERASVERAATSSAEAYSLYLEAWSLWVLRQENTRVDALLDQAIELDPDFALAYGFRAWRTSERLTNSMVGSSVGEAQLESQRQRATELAARALGIDPYVQFASTALADMLFFSWHWSEAAEAYERAVRVAPHDAFARGYYGFLKAMLGKTDEAIALQRPSIALNPGNWQGHVMMGFHLGYAKRFSAAIAEFREALSVMPGFALAQLWQAYMEIASGDFVAGGQTLALAEETLGERPTAVALPELILAYDRLGQPADVKRVLGQIEAFGSDFEQSFGAGGNAMILVALGEHDRALAALGRLAEKAASHRIDAGFINAMNLKLNVMELPVLHEPRYREALARIIGK